MIGILVLYSRDVDLVVIVRIFDVNFPGIDSHDGAYSSGEKRACMLWVKLGLTILLMHSLDFEQELPAPDHIVIELIETCNGRESRPWEFAKGVKVETIDALKQNIANGGSTPEPQYVRVHDVARLVANTVERFNSSAVENFDKITQITQLRAAGPF